MDQALGQKVVVDGRPYQVVLALTALVVVVQWPMIGLALDSLSVVTALVFIMNIRLRPSIGGDASKEA